jgi:peptidoglycan/LPS O-acetylase OafA/YrhL
MAGLDGLRAVAVLAVVLYHLNVGWASGGLLGVGVFFVLSGYLITDLLLAEREREGAIALGRFWLRRARRLLPALWVMLVVVTLWIAFLDPPQVAGLRGALLAALLYFSNWWYAFQHVSYFASFGPPSPLGHLWSLAVEEQFYLVWPLLLILAIRFVHRRWLLTGLVVLAAVVSAWAMAAIFQPGSDPTRVYEGTDTRAFQLLIGATLAFVWPSRRLSGSLSALRRRGLDALGAVGVAVIVAMVIDTNEYETFLYRGGMVILSLATVAVVAVLAHPSTLLSRILGVPPLRWIGVRSYGIYLWHYPIIVLTSPTVGAASPLLTLGQVGATVAVAALSWRFVEEPIRRQGFRAVFAGLTAPRWSVRGVPTGLWAGVGAAGLLLGATGLGLSGVVSAAPAESLMALPASLVEAPSPTVPPAPTAPGPPRTMCGPPSAVPVVVAAPAAASPPAPSSLAVTVVGDSIMIDVAPDLHALLPNAYITGAVSRQMAALPTVLAELNAAGELYSRLVIELGTNGPGWDPGQVAGLLRSLQLQQVVLVNAGRDPAHPEWPAIINQQLLQVAAAVPNTVVVDWYTASTGHPEYFMWGDDPGDGIHPGPIGAEAMAELIAQAVGSSPPPSSSSSSSSSPSPSPSPAASESATAPHTLRCPG